MSRTDWSSLDSAYNEQDVVKLERRMNECKDSGEPFDPDAEIARLRAAGEWPVLTFYEKIILDRRKAFCESIGIPFDERAEMLAMHGIDESKVETVPFWDPRAWTFWGILKLFVWVAAVAMLIGRVSGG